MPRGDRTGPAGMGSMTGRGMGYCAGYDKPGFANPVPGMGFGRGFGGGRGFGRGFGLGRGLGRGWRWAGYAPVPEQYVPIRATPVQPAYTKKDELADLKAEKEIAERDIKAIQEEIKAMEQRIKEIEKK